MNIMCVYIYHGDVIYIIRIVKLTKIRSGGKSSAVCSSIVKRTKKEPLFFGVRERIIDTKEVECVKGD